MRKYRLKTSALYIICAGIFVVTSAAVLLVRHYLMPFKIIMYTLIALFCAAAVLTGFILLPLYFRRTVIYLSPVEITVHTGLWFYRRDHMRLSAVQYVTKISLPLSSLTGFNFIAVRALGGTLLLPFLNSHDCDEIVNALHLEISRR